VTDGIWPLAGLAEAKNGRWNEYFFRLSGLLTGFRRSLRYVTRLG
jgi:hypothetical protein